jgi:hypothetical protein
MALETIWLTVSGEKPRAFTREGHKEEETRLTCLAREYSIYTQRLFPKTHALLAASGEFWASPV